MKMRNFLNELSLTGPSMFWLFVFFLVPTVSVLLVSIHPSDAFGNILPGWTLANLDKFTSHGYWVIIWRTLWMSGVSTIICIMLAIPVAYFMISRNPSFKRALLILIIVPFWTHFLIRVFAWKAVLNPEGFLRKFLIYFHIISDQTLLLYNPYVVLMVIIYTYLPFAILPIFAAADKFDFGLMEAAYDLGASRTKAFFKIFIPSISAGITAGSLMVFIPALGSYVIPEMVGGIGSEMVGNMIAEKVFVGRNIPEASMWASVLIMVIVGLLALRFTFSVLTKKTGKAGEYNETLSI
jgi:spermidine/putrescine transport system permease protein